MSGATTGKASIYNLNEKAYLNQRVGLFRANKDKLYYGYLVQFVFSKLFYRQLDTVLVAGAQPNISSKDIEDFKFNLPCLKEQIKIRELSALPCLPLFTCKTIFSCPNTPLGLLLSSKVLHYFLYV